MSLQGMVYIINVNQSARVSPSPSGAGRENPRFSSTHQTCRSIDTTALASFVSRIFGLHSWRGGSGDATSIFINSLCFKLERKTLKSLNWISSEPVKPPQRLSSDLRLSDVSSDVGDQVMRRDFVHLSVVLYIWCVACWSMSLAWH